MSNTYRYIIVLLTVLLLVLTSTFGCIFEAPPKPKEYFHISIDIIPENVHNLVQTWSLEKRDDNGDLVEHYEIISAISTSEVQLIDQFVSKVQFVAIPGESYKFDHWKIKKGLIGNTHTTLTTDTYDLVLSPDTLAPYGDLEDMVFICAYFVPLNPH
jgi:hypothetical protein